MRTDRSSALAGVVGVAALIALSGCARDETSSTAVVPAPAPEPPRADLEEPPTPVLPSRAQSIGVNQTATRAEPLPQIEQPMQRLVFQCTDEVAFAVRMVGDLLHVYAPSLRGGSLPLTRQPAETGLLYAVAGAEFRTDGELATLRLGDELYVDCVANPAAAVWETEPPRTLLE